jgi:hypothetical protein
MKREKRLTKRERKVLVPPRPGNNPEQEKHIHCIACGRHLESTEFDDPATATMLRCQHKSTFPACVACATQAQMLLAEHDRTGQPVKTVGAWH